MRHLGVNQHGLKTGSLRKPSPDGHPAISAPIGPILPALAQMEAALSEALDGRIRPMATVRLHAPRPAYLARVRPVLGRMLEVLPDVTLVLSIDAALAKASVGIHDLVIRCAAFVGD